MPDQYERILYLKEVQSKKWRLVSLEVTKVSMNQHNEELESNKNNSEYIVEYKDQGNS